MAPSRCEYCSPHLGVKPPQLVGGPAQDPIDGVSCPHTCDSPDAAEHQKTLFFDIGNSLSNENA